MMSASPHQYPGLDQFGRSVVQLLDYRIAAILTLVLTVIGMGMHKKRMGSLPSMSATLNACMGVFSIFGGLVIGVILLFTRPPAFHLLSNDSLGIIGLVTLISMLYLGVTQIRDSLFPATPPQKREDLSSAQASKVSLPAGEQSDSSG